MILTTSGYQVGDTWGYVGIYRLKLPLTKAAGESFWDLDLWY